jgi:hypothetical protein
MSGQSAALSKEEACKMQKQIQHPGSHATGNGGKGSSGTYSQTSHNTHQK